MDAATAQSDRARRLPGAGNPAIARPEDAVANCYPGLELDVRNLDRRFFPGLVFEFVARDDTGDPYIEPTRYGARLSYVDQYGDPDISDCPGLSDELSNNAGTLGTGEWYIEWIEQEGRRLSMLETRAGETLPMDGLFVWRLIRGLRPKAAVTLCLHQRHAQSADVIFHGIRRNFTDPVTGVISLAYQPGEMLQSLCSPWQHDFRDCYCHYWASNHPDIVFGELLPAKRSCRTASRRIRCRRLRASTGCAPNARRRWRGGRRTASRSTVPSNTTLSRSMRRGVSSTSSSTTSRSATTIPRPVRRQPNLSRTLPNWLRRYAKRLAPLEMALAFEYLYARSSLLTEEEAQSRSGDQATKDRAAVCLIYARHFLLLTAASEMQHLRWANELIWRLYQEKLVPGNYVPVLTPARDIPQPPSKGGARSRCGGSNRKRCRISSTSSGRAARSTERMRRVIATLRSDARYPTQMQQLAERIANDGMGHERHFLDMRAVLRRMPGESSYLRELKRADPGDSAIGTAMGHFRNIKSELDTAFRSGADRDLPAMGKSLNGARDLMDKLLAETDELARNGVGFPYDAL